MSILRGHFAMVLDRSARPRGSTTTALRADLDARARAASGSRRVSLTRGRRRARRADPTATHMVSVYGADHPGIVHAVAEALARRRGEHHRPGGRGSSARKDGEPLYVMLLEVRLPGDADEPARGAARARRRGAGGRGHGARDRAATTLKSAVAVRSVLRYPAPAR